MMTMAAATTEMMLIVLVVAYQCQVVSGVVGYLA